MDDLKDCEPFSAYAPKLRRVFEKADVIVGYNVSFDTRYEWIRNALDQMTPDDIRVLVRENRALKVQVRKMQAEMPLIKSLQKRIRILERRLAEK